MNKPDAARILKALDTLRAASWLGKMRQKWPDQIYHFTDVHNAAEIVKCGTLYSRATCAEKGLLRVDAADKAVIASSTDPHKYARLYFAPRTPTQYLMEGVRPLDQRRHEAHCPVPVFFVFDSRKLLIRKDCLFSNGNLASSNHTIGSDAKFFEQLDFRDIYHRSAVTGSDARRIINARHSEVLFERELVLDASLIEVVCRTGPERDTLLSLIGRKLAPGWKAGIRLEGPDEGLFERRYYYVRDIFMLGPEVYVELNRPCGQSQHLDVTFPGDSREHRIRPAGTQGERTTVYRLPKSSASIGVVLTMTDSVAYRGALSDSMLFPRRQA